MTGAPILCDWDGESLTPINHTWAKRADEDYVVGARYFVEGKEPRSQASHNHYFASLHDAWMNLPEAVAERFATADHLRAYALIKAGYHDQRSIVAESKAAARRVAAFVKPLDDFAVVVVEECTVTIYTAKSQSMRAMGKEPFQASKTAVLGIVAGMAGVEAGDLKREAGQAA